MRTCLSRSWDWNRSSTISSAGFRSLAQTLGSSSTTKFAGWRRLRGGTLETDGVEVLPARPLPLSRADIVADPRSRRGTGQASVERESDRQGRRSPWRGRSARSWSRTAALGFRRSDNRPLIAANRALPDRRCIDQDVARLRREGERFFGPWMPGVPYCGMSWATRFRSRGRYRQARLARRVEVRLAGQSAFNARSPGDPLRHGTLTEKYLMLRSDTTLP